MLYDKDIREPLFEYLDEKIGNNRIIEEKQIGKSRADVMMITEEAIWGIEIKSDADTYVRLDRQVKDYNRFFDYNMVVVGSSHAEHIEEHVPEYWGIITVEEFNDQAETISSGESNPAGKMVDMKVDFYMLREPKRNPKREKTILFRNQISFLWRPELAHIQEINRMHKYARLSKLDLVKKMMETVPAEELKKQVCAELMNRDYTTIAETINAYRAEQGRRPKRAGKKKRVKV
ncbi:MAG: sce7726 family protein [Lachnospiraceae bacterium]|nr:sce7726 family protein [Candidatus Equihabitans merdae]